MEWRKFCWAALFPGATERNVPTLQYMLQSQAAKNWHAIVHGIFVVPLIARTVDEDGNIRQSVVTINDITRGNVNKFL